MKIKYILTTGALAIAGIALFGPSAKAQTSWNDGDLFLGIRNVGGGTGSGSDILLDIGQGFNFSAPFSLSLSGLATDLSNTFGSTWAANANIQFAVIGGTLLNDDMYATNPSSLRWQASGDESTPSNDVSSMENAWVGNTSNATSNSQELIQSTGGSSYASFMPGGANGANIGFGYFNPTIEGPVSGPLNFEHVPEGGTDKLLGTLKLVQDGSTAANADLTFTSASVPEPSTFAAIGLGAAFLAFTRRNRARA